mgnify:CR=1 FL=1
MPPSSDRAQPWVVPMPMSTKRPDFGLSSPSLVEPQQAMVPLVSSPQFWNEPEEMDEKFTSSGGSVAPMKLFPQQLAAPGALLPAAIVNAFVFPFLTNRSHLANLGAALLGDRRGRRLVRPVEQLDELGRADDLALALLVVHPCDARPTRAMGHLSWRRAEQGHTLRLEEKKELDLQDELFLAETAKDSTVIPMISVVN